MLRCIAVDDEPLALDIIEKYISRISELQLISRCSSALEALEVLKQQDVDLVFLDIQMSELTGIQFLKSLKNPPMVIFTTAYDQYALEGYDLDVVDYLLKPIPFDRFLKAVNKASDIYASQKLKSDSPDPQRDFLFVRSEYQLVKITLGDILYIEGLKDYVKIFSGPKPVFSHQNLKTIESKLPSKDFIRIHKSYIVSVKKIEVIQKNFVVIGGNEIPIGDSYREQLYKLINEDKS
jgi:DNA-binding LytR/AlgR family response regulator